MPPRLVCELPAFVFVVEGHFLVDQVRVCAVAAEDEGEEIELELGKEVAMKLKHEPGQQGDDLQRATQRQKVHKPVQRGHTVHTAV